MKQKIEIFDTTLRDGTQGEGVNLSTQDKIVIAQKLDEFGIDFIEGGWPGSNPRDEDFFKKIKKVKLKNAKICAFGSTARNVKKIKDDANLNALLKAETEVVVIFGKSWELHSSLGLGLTENENESLIYKSVEYLKKSGREVIYDAEHFFDGYKTNPKFALKMILAAEKAGARTIVLCDTNGGTLPTEVSEIVSKIKKIIKVPIGIHAHNDCELGVANSLSAIKSGATHVHGTINGVGERCGNANLSSIIPNIILKMNLETNQKIDLSHLTPISNFVYEVMNLNPNTRAAFVGKSAFAHKGGVHVSAVLKDSRMYEHIEPKLIGNIQRVLVSDLSGQSNIKYKAKELGIDLFNEKEISKKVVKNIKELEFEGYQYDGAEASFELLLRNELNETSPFYKIIDSKIIVSREYNRKEKTEAILKIEVNGEIEHTAAEGNGPVNALDNALRKALVKFYPQIKNIELIDYKVRVLNEKHGTGAKVRVMITSRDGKEDWSTVGVSENIIEASFQALNDSLNYKLFKLFPKQK